MESLKYRWIMFLGLILVVALTATICGFLQLATEEATQVVDGFVNSLDEWFVKLFILVIWIILFSVLVFHVLLEIPISQIRQTLRLSNNDSYAILFAGIAFSGLILIVLSKGETLGDYLTFMLLRGSVSVSMSIFSTMALAYMAGIPSVDEFFDNIASQKTNSYAIYVATLWVVSNALGMTI